MNWLQNIQARSIQKAQYRAAGTPPNVSTGEGFITHDIYDAKVFDDLLRKFLPWSIVTKHAANSDFTTGFLQSAFGAARPVDKNTLTFSATTATRTTRTPVEIKAITSDRNFGMYKRSLTEQQNNPHGDLTQKDIGDITSAMFKEWNRQFYNGTLSGDPLEFDGLKILIGSGTTVLSTASVVKAIQAKVVDMMNSSSKSVMPTHVFANPVVAYYITQEQMKMKINDNAVGAPGGVVIQGVQCATIDTQAGRLPIIADPFNSVVAGTPNVYPTHIISNDKLRWEYVEPLGQAGAEPKVFEFPMTTVLDTPYKGIMFGALDGDGFSDHFARLNVEVRTTIVDPTA